MIGIFSYLVFFGIVVLILGIATLGLNLQWGSTGLFNAGVVGFYGVGGYTLAILTAPGRPELLGNFGLPWIVGVVGAMAASAIAAGIVGIATVRLRGDYLAIATFGIATTLQLVALNWERLTGGSLGLTSIPRPLATVFDGSVEYNLFFLGLVAAIAGLVYGALERLVRSPWGRVLKAVREDETAAIALGKDARLFRLQAFVLGSTVIGLAGALYVSFIGFVSPFDFVPIITFQIWTMLIVGGSGNNKGAMLGVLIVWGLWSASGTLVSKVVPATWQTQGGAMQAILIGLLLVLVLLFKPRGLIGEEPVVSRHIGEKRREMAMIRALIFMFAGLLASGAAQAQTACPVKIGGILPLTGSMGPIAKHIAESAQLAIDHINKGGGVKGCQVQLILRDDQGQPTVGVDAAKYLIDVEGVKALTGSVSSGVTLPILTAVAVPAKMPLISCCSTAATFTSLAQEGKTGGFFFRTLPTVKTQAYASAKGAADRGYKRIAMIYVNTDFGTGMVKDFSKAMERLGGKVVTTVAYNENQPWSRAEVNAAMVEKPDALFLVAFTADGATMTRDWISLGGTQNLILNNALRSPDYVKLVGAKFLQSAFGMDNASVAGPTVDAFKTAFQTAFNASPDGPGIYNQYDAVMVLGLAMNISSDLSGPAIRDSVRKIQNPAGEVVGTGPDEFKKAVDLIKAGRPVRYVGATGPVTFDVNGDVSGPALLWIVKGDNLAVDRTMSLDEMTALFKQIDG